MGDLLKNYLIILSNFFTNKKVGLNVSRLRIHDKLQVVQINPLKIAKRKYKILFNGAIFNFKNLKKKRILGESFYNFRYKVLLKGYNQIIIIFL